MTQQSYSYTDIIFDADRTLSQPAREVLADLMNCSQFYDINDRCDYGAMARVTGRRDVLSRIIGMLNLRDKDVVMFRGKGKVDGLV